MPVIPPSSPATPARSWPQPMPTPPAEQRDMGSSRRDFLSRASQTATLAALGTLPPAIARALAVEPSRLTGTIADVAHVIILMQENRSFDHYFGTLKGVRGFGDPHPMALPSGKSVWHQPDGTGELLPFRPEVPDLGRTFLPDPPHGWNDTHAAWNAGRYDGW